MDLERFEEIKQRLANATPGPWNYHDFGYPGMEEPQTIVVYQGDKFDWESVSEGEYIFSTPIWEGQENDNCDFVAHARQDIEDLVAHVERLERMVAVTNKVNEILIDKVKAYKNEAEESQERSRKEFDRKLQLMKDEALRRDQ